QPQPLGPDAAQATLNPGQSLTFDLTCTPGDYKVHLATFVVTTNDPTNPKLRYNLSCEVRVDSPPEPLSPASTYASGAGSFEAVAVSPDGTQVLAGQADITGTLRMFSRNAASGALTGAGTLSSGGMGFVYGAVYSHDGKNVYYSSSTGDGVV